MSSVTLASALDAIGWKDAELLEELPAGWHGDQHWRIRDPTGASASLRVVREGRPVRWEDERAHGIDLVLRQVEVGKQFRARGLPFMQLVAGPRPVPDGVVVAFEWIDARPLRVPSPDAASAVGAMARAFHEAGRTLDPIGLPRHDLRAAARRSLQELSDLVPNRFLERARQIAAQLEHAEPLGIATHGDLNLPNVLWDDAVVGVVDFDQIGVQDPLEELAWLIKWWSRPAGVGDTHHDADLAHAVLCGYDARDVDLELLAARLWVTGCLNGNSVIRIKRARLHERQRMAEVLFNRADLLSSVVA